MKLFKNPLSNKNFSDPFITYDETTGYYYFIASCQCNELTIYRNKTLSGILNDGDCKVVYKCEGVNQEYGPMWAPEMYKIENKWYIYTSCREVDSDNIWDTKRLMILTSKTEDPFDGFEFASKPDIKIFAIDPTFTIIDGKKYMCYSQVADDGVQVLMIREMKDAMTFTDNVAEIARPTLSWELKEGYKGNHAIAEGAFFLKKDGRLFIVYSANGCWSDDYCLGVLEYVGGEICDADSWKKHAEPLFVKGNGIFGVGHASFFDSPDKKEVWCAYHCLLRSNPERKEMDRHTCIQKISFDKTGYPVMGMPIGVDIWQESPSGEQN